MLSELGEGRCLATNLVLMLEDRHWFARNKGKSTGKDTHHKNKTNDSWRELGDSLINFSDEFKIGIKLEENLCFYNTY